jgi:glucose/arabinose dehydrogenase
MPFPARGLTAAAVLAMAAMAQAQVALQKTLIVQGLDRPVWIGAPPGDRDRLFVIEQKQGRIRIVKQGTLLSTPFLNLGSSAVAQGGEQGLLCMAFHPHYAQNGLFFVYYCRRSDDATVLARYQVSAGNPDVANPGSATTLLTIAQPESWHNGGALHFGPEGNLYVSVGDGGGTDGCNSQSRSTLLGKILRLDVDTGNPYAIPPTNPFVGQPGARGEIWHIGLRNPWRFCFDRLTGDLYVADVGAATREEVSLQPAGHPGGLNYGWGMMEGTTCQTTCSGQPACQHPSLVLPLHQYVNDQAGSGQGCAIVGGVAYRGCSMPSMHGRYFFGDFCSARIWSFRVIAGQMLDLQEHTADINPPGQTMQQLSTFGEDARGELYVANLAGGRVWRIEPEPPSPVTDIGGGQPGGNGMTPLYELCGTLLMGTPNEVVLRRAAPNATAVLLVATRTNGVTLPIGTILVDPIVEMHWFTTDTAGEVGFSFDGRPPPTLFTQWVVFDPSAPMGAGISNALQLDFPSPVIERPRR